MKELKCEHDANELLSENMWYTVKKSSIQAMAEPQVIKQWHSYFVLAQLHTAEDQHPTLVTSTAA